MNRPDTGTMLAGHPVVVAPVTLVSVLAIGSAVLGHGSWPIAVFAFLLMVPLAKVSGQRTKYLAWKREWDSMAPSSPPAAKPRRKGRPVLGSLMLLALGLFFAAHADDPVYALALAWLIAAVAIAGTVALIHRAVTTRRAAPKPAKVIPVTICVRGPLLSVPRTLDAYRALPPHCQTLFALQEQRNWQPGVAHDDLPGSRRCPIQTPDIRR